jgi:hypothetical protein
MRAGRGRKVRAAGGNLVDPVFLAEKSETRHLVSYLFSGWSRLLLHVPVDEEIIDHAQE